MAMSQVLAGMPSDGGSRLLSPPRRAHKQVCPHESEEENAPNEQCARGFLDTRHSSLATNRCRTAPNVASDPLVGRLAVLAFLATREGSLDYPFSFVSQLYKHFLGEGLPRFPDSCLVLFDVEL